MNQGKAAVEVGTEAKAKALAEVKVVVTGKAMAGARDVVKV